MDAVCVADNLNQAASGSSCDDLIGLQPEWTFRFLKNLEHATDHLHREGFLADVVVRLDDNFKKPPGSE